MNGYRLAWSDSATTLGLISEALQNSMNSLEADLFQKKINLVTDLDPHLCKAAYFMELDVMAGMEPEETSSLGEKLVTYVSKVADQFIR